MRHSLHTPASDRSIRRVACIGMAFTSAAFIAGANALPASAATTPAVRPPVAGVLTDVPPGVGDSIETGGERGGQHAYVGGVPSYIPGPWEPHRDPFGAYGPNSCKQGYVWRDKWDGDSKCVTPEERQRVHDENPHRQPGGGAYGPFTCMPGYVWRESYYHDTLCVTPEERQAAKNSNGTSPFVE